MMLMIEWSKDRCMCTPVHRELMMLNAVDLQYRRGIGESPWGRFAILFLIRWGFLPAN